MIVRVTRDFQEEGNGGILFWPKLIRLFGRRTRRGFWCFDSSHSWHEKGTVVQLWMWAEKSDGLMAECHTRHVLHCCCVYRAIANGKKEERGLCLRQRLLPNRSQTLSLSLAQHLRGLILDETKNTWSYLLLFFLHVPQTESECCSFHACAMFFCANSYRPKNFFSRPRRSIYFLLFFSPVECSTGCWSCLPFVSPPRFVCFLGGSQCLFRMPAPTVWVRRNS